jgi:hypothetical protein
MLHEYVHAHVHAHTHNIVYEIWGFHGSENLSLLGRMLYSLVGRVPMFWRKIPESTHTVCQSYGAVFKFWYFVTINARNMNEMWNES